MKHRSHLICFALIGLAAMFFLIPRSSAGFGAGIGFALLLCPLVMGTMMWLMMRRPDTSSNQPVYPQSRSTEDQKSTSEVAQR